MDSALEPERWLICPVCLKPNPPERKFCQYCWGAVLRPDISVSSSELEEVSKHRLAYLKRRKLIKSLRVSLVSLIASVTIVYLILYSFTDIVSKPPQEVNSNSRAGEWAMFRRDLGHSGNADSSGSLPQGTLKWTFTTGGPIHSSPAIANGIIYIGSRDNKLYAIDIATGNKRWEYATGSWVDSSPAVVNGVVYFGSNDGNLYALDAQSGKKLWDFPTKYPVTSSPAVANGRVYFGAEDYFVYALDAVKGTKLWHFNTKGTVVSSPAVANGIVYIGSAGEFSYALDSRNGRLRLRFKTFSSVFASPVVSGETVYFATSFGYFYAVEGNARTQPREHEIRPLWFQLWLMGLPIPQPPTQSGLLWSLKISQKATSSPVVIGNTLYIGADTKLLAIDLQNRQKRWVFETEGSIRSSPAVANNTIYVGSEDGRLYALDATTGKKLWNILTGSKITSSPAVADGTVYIASHDGNLYAIK